MRRALLACAVLIPVVVAAAITAAVGQLLETTNYNAKGGTSYVNAAQCAGTATVDPLSVEFNVQTSTGTAPSGGSYTLYASTAAPAPVNNVGSFCATTDAASANPPVFAGSVGTVTVDSAVKDVTISGSQVVSVVHKDCTSTNENQQIWICAHWTNANSQLSGWATGKFTLQFAAPDPPIGIGASAGDGKLAVSWTPATTGAILADHFIAQATPAAGGTTVYSSSSTGTSTTIGGLQNGTAYAVRVIAYSIGGNPSAASASVTGTPLAGADFWEVYKARGGVEEGGCGPGGTGPLALLGVAALLAARRRRS